MPRSTIILGSNSSGGGLPGTGLPGTGIPGGGSGGSSGGGSFAFLQLRGQVVPGGQAVEPFDRPGVDGVSFIKIGVRGRPFTLVGFAGYGSMSDAVGTAKQAVASLSGELCTVYDSSGVKHGELMCLLVRPLEPRPIALGTGSLYGRTAVAEIEFTFVERRTPSGGGFGSF